MIDFDIPTPLSIIAYLVGATLGIFAAFRYLVIYNDIFRGVSWVFLGLGIMFVGWVYGRFKFFQKLWDYTEKIDKDILKLQNQVDDLLRSHKMVILNPPVKTVNKVERRGN